MLLGEKIPHPTRQLVAVAYLTVLARYDELKLHIHAALNMGCSKEEVAEVIFQMFFPFSTPIKFNVVWTVNKGKNIAMKMIFITGIILIKAGRIPIRTDML